MSNHISPALDLKAFTCSFCGTLAQQSWSHTMVTKRGNFVNVTPEHDFSVSVSTCINCNKKLLFKNSKIVDPKVSSVPLSLNEMPSEVKVIYDEARLIVSDSPRSACALLRLAIESLLDGIVPTTGNLNSKIGELVKKGLDVRVKQSLDLVRITGNNAIHPGKIFLNDSIEIAIDMFRLVNFIVDQLIIQPEITNKLFSSLPDSSISQINNRDGQQNE